MSEGASIIVRHPAPGEFSGAGVTGFEKLAVDPDWAWIAERDGQRLAVLLVAACHGAAMPLRLVAEPSAGPGCLRAIVRQATKECRDRGLKGFFLCFDPAAKCGPKLARLAARIAAGRSIVLEPRAVGWIGGPL